MKKNINNNFFVKTEEKNRGNQIQNNLKTIMEQQSEKLIRDSASACIFYQNIIKRKTIKTQTKYLSEYEPRLKMAAYAPIYQTCVMFFIFIFAASFHLLLNTFFFFSFENSD